MFYCHNRIRLLVFFDAPACPGELSAEFQTFVYVFMTAGKALNNPGNFCGKVNTNKPLFLQAPTSHLCARSP